MANAYIDKIAIATDTYDIQDSTARAILENAREANTVFAGPVNGSAATPSFRALTSADLPLGTVTAPGALKPDGSTFVVNNGIISAIGSGGSSGEDIEVDYIAQTVTIAASAWNGTTATVTVNGVTVAKEVIVSAEPSSILAWGASRIYCSGQGTNSLTFNCTTTPTAAISANIIVFEGSTPNAAGVDF